MSTKAIAKISAKIVFDNGKILEVSEGDILENITYRKDGVLSRVSGAIRVISAITAKNDGIPDDCLPEPFVHDYIRVVNLIIDTSTNYDAELILIPINHIIDIEKVLKDGSSIHVGTGNEFRSLYDVINEADSGSTIKLETGVYDKPLDLNKSIRIVGSGDTVISGALNIGNAQSRTIVEPVIIELENVKLTGDAILTLNNADGLIMKNCVFGGHNLTSKTNPIYFNVEKPIYVEITGCTFEAENEFSYNLLEINGLLKSGSKISGNVFKKGSCTHNQINIYNVVDNAFIEINNNICEVSKNMVRIGMKGSPKCIINMNSNEYYETDFENPEYAGLFLVQPYGTQTVSFADTEINVFNTIKPEGIEQICYLYAGNKDMKFTDDNKPVITIDGEIIEPIVLG